MRSQDRRVKAAKELLEVRLGEVFVETSAACRQRLWELDDPVVIGEGVFGGDGSGGDFVVRDFIELWKEQLAFCIREVFELFVEGREPQREEEHPGDTAKGLAWEAIDQEFCWTPGDRSNSARCREWLSAAAYPEPALQHLSSSDELGWQDFTADVLARDFPEWFERLLNKLRLEAFVNAPTARSTEPADSIDRNANGTQSGFVHSEDYRAITMDGERYSVRSSIIRASISDALDIG